jgi:peptidoglycan/LPS O-acetylase OafA/YrhL
MKTIPPGEGVMGVTLRQQRRSKVEIYRKAIVAAVVAVVSLIGVFAALEPNTAESIGAVVAALANVFLVYELPNTPARDAQGKFRG